PTPSSAEQVEVGVHGVMVEGRGKQAVLLPQVAEEHGWSACTFLDQTCRKAGLDPEAWRHQDVRLATFTADVFGESEGL
ncbi:MAG: AMMECR1 domain-containing protein, partial [Myxococcota bacterium]